MKCAKCGYENEYDKEYCGNCGETLKKKNTRSNNGFEEVDLDVLDMPLPSPALDQPKPLEAEPAPQVTNENLSQIPPAIGQILQQPVATPQPTEQQIVQAVTAAPSFSPITNVTPPQQVVQQAVTQTPVPTVAPTIAPTQPPVQQTAAPTVQPTPQPVATQAPTQTPTQTEVEQLEEHILEPMHKNKFNWKDKGLLAILGCGIIAFAIIGTLITMSITSVNKKDKEPSKVKYREIQGEWIDNSKKNYFIITNNSYTWYQDYSNDKEKQTSGEIKALSGKKALNYLRITEKTAKTLLSIDEECDINNFYSLKMFTSKLDRKHAYYKMLLYTSDDSIITYNFNDKQLYFLYKK